MHTTKERGGEYIHIGKLILWKILVKLAISALFIKLQISWPADVDCVGDEVDVDEWWESVDMRIVEQAAISRSVKAPVLKAEKIAPWIPPMCRNTTVVNSETQKGNCTVIILCMPECTYSL